MKEISELKLPDDLKYTDDHEWAKAENDGVKVGISDYAQDQLGDIVFVELPEIGAKFAQGDEFGTVESVKAVSELYTPLSGEVIAINETLEDAPEKVNQEPYRGGWMVKIKPDDPAQLEALMDKAAYLAMLKAAT
ncbi:MAG: glycine cleavage system protein GcvH [Desulfobacterales bacterium]|jgi:glycine cleavage system H protein